VIRVLLADDHELVRSGLRGMLDAQDDIEVVGEAADGGGAVEEALRLRPDVVIMDIRMPHVDGIEATRRLLAHEGAPRILVLTTFDHDESSGRRCGSAPAASCSRTRARGRSRRRCGRSRPATRCSRRR
jgi:DNA-binding NarL/FixJ family response regulator